VVDGGPDQAEQAVAVVLAILVDRVMENSIELARRPK
jgi:hypothetical protein